MCTIGQFALHRTLCKNYASQIFTPPPQVQFSFEKIKTNGKNGNNFTYTTHFSKVQSENISHNIIAFLEGLTQL